MRLSGGRARAAHALDKLQRLVLVNHAGHCGGEGRAAAGSLGAGEIRGEDGEERQDMYDWGFHFRASHRPVNHHRCRRRRNAASAAPALQNQMMAEGECMTAVGGCGL